MAALVVVERKPRRLVLDQHSPQVLKLAESFGLLPEAMCGFLALSVAMTTDSINETNDIDGDATIVAAEQHDTILSHCRQHVLPWFQRYRSTYIDEHPDEFVATGTPWQKSQGRMDRSTYRSAMASTVELSRFLQEQTNHSNNKARVALLRNIVQGPPVNETSIRFPHTKERFVSAEEQQYLQDEVPFYDCGKDYFVQVMAPSMPLSSEKQEEMQHEAGDANGQDNHQNTMYWTVERWISNVLQSEADDSTIHNSNNWNVILDGFGHYMVLHVAHMSRGPNRKIVLQILDTLVRDADDNNDSNGCVGTNEKDTPPMDIPGQDLMQWIEEAAVKSVP